MVGTRIARWIILAVPVRWKTRLPMTHMTPKERIDTAIRLGKPDRVPVIPVMDFFSSRYGGITQKEMFFDLARADEALQKTLDDLGDMDGMGFSYAGMGRILGLYFPSRPRLPGVDGIPDDGQFQFVERSLIEPEEYLAIAGDPRRWLLKKMVETHPEMTGPAGLAKSLAVIAADVLRMRRSIDAWDRKGLKNMMAYNFAFTPMEYVSLMLRSFDDFILDMFRHPDEVKAACRALMKPMKETALFMVVLGGSKGVFLSGTRTSASSISPKQFEEFALPEWLEMCTYFAGKGYTPILHFDSDWTAFLPFFRDFPAGCILNLDGTTDIFKAKEVLGDRMCIMGDVPAALLKLGEPDEVDEYCRRLITEVGSDGGFILSSGCTVPIDAKPENVSAMLQSVKRYRP